MGLHLSPAYGLPDGICPHCKREWDVENTDDYAGHQHEADDIVRCPACDRRIRVQIEIVRRVTIEKPSNQASCTK